MLCQDRIAYRDTMLVRAGSYKSRHDAGFTGDHKPVQGAGQIRPDALHCIQSLFLDLDNPEGDTRLAQFLCSTW